MMLHICDHENKKSINFSKAFTETYMPLLFMRRKVYANGVLLAICYAGLVFV